MLNRLILWIGLLAVCAPLFGAESIMLVSDADTTYYETFPDALKVANKKPQAHMTLLDDVSFDGEARTQTVKTNLTLDLNGYSLGDSLASYRLLSMTIDSLTLRIFSSRPGGRIHVARTHNGTIYAVYCSRGTLDIDGITIEGSNLAEDAENYPKASARGVNTGAECALIMNNTLVTVFSSGSASAIYAGGTTRVTHTRAQAFCAKNAYAIQTKGHTVLAHDSLYAEASGASSYALNMATDTVFYTASHCSFIAVADSGTVIAANLQKGALEAQNSSFEAVAKASGKNVCTVSAGSKTQVALLDCKLVAEGENGTKGFYGGGNKDASAQVDIRRCNIVARGKKSSYGISCFGTSYIEDCAIEALADSDAYVYGIQVNNFKDTITLQDAQTTITHVTVQVQAGNRAYGIYTKAPAVLSRDTVVARTERDNCTGFYAQNDSAHFVLDRCSFTAAAGDNTVSGAYLYRGHMTARDCFFSGKGKYKIYGVQLAGKGDITNCKMNVQADSASYAVYTGSTCDTVDVRDCYLKINTLNKSGVLNLNKKAFGLFTIQGGFYTDDSNLKTYLPSDTCAVYRIRSGVEYSAGYRYVIRDTGNPGVTVAQVYETGKTTLLKDFNSLASALLYTIYDDTKNYTVVVTADCRLNESDYYIPAYVTLVVAYREGQKAAMGTKPLREDGTNAKPFEYVRLTMKSGARMIVDGIIEVSAIQKRSYNIEGCVSGDYGYGRIHMEPGSSITLGKNAKLCAWGYITGQGTITAQAGAAVYEQLQVGEWKGGTVTYNLINNPKRVFPFTHFFYQNIEAPITYQAGAKAFGSTYIAVSVGSVACDDIRLLADKDALFIMPTDDPDASVSKVYDPLTDRVTWTTRGHTALSELSLIMRMGGFDFSMPSSHYILPVGTYMTIRAESGTLTVENDVSLLPGARVEVAPGAQALIPQGTKLYVYDIDDWGTWCDRSQFTVNYSPSWTDCPRDTIQPSARMIIGGEMRVEGSLYTTEHGAEIRGIEEAEGQILLANQPQPEDYIYQVTGSGFDFVYSPATLTPARLMNADGTFTPTQGAKAGTTFTYAAGQWTCPQDAYEALDQIPNDQPITNKRIKDGRLYITVGNKQYTATGQLTR